MVTIVVVQAFRRLAVQDTARQVLVLQDPMPRLRVYVTLDTVVIVQRPLVLNALLAILRLAKAIHDVMPVL